VPFEGTPAHGTYRLRGTLHPTQGKPVRIDQQIDFDQAAADELKREAGQQAKSAGIPTLLAAIVGATLLLLCATLAALLRRQQQLSHHPSYRARGARSAARACSFSTRLSDKAGAKNGAARSLR
jgi:hypothetical protein